MANYLLEKTEKRELNRHYLIFYPEYSELNVYNDINHKLDNKLDLEKLHLSFLYYKIFKKYEKAIYPEKIEAYCTKLFQNIKLYPMPSNNVIQTLNDNFVIIYQTNYEINKKIDELKNYIIDRLIHYLNKKRIKWTKRYRCEADDGVWLYIDIHEKNKTYGIFKIRMNKFLPHVSFSLYSLYRKEKPITTHDIRKVYRDRKLRSKISNSRINLRNGFFELS